MAKTPQGQTENLRKGTEAAQKSPKAGRFETNRNAKIWILQSPDGITYTARNLNKFIRDHPDLFNESL